MIPSSWLQCLAVFVMSLLPSCSSALPADPPEGLRLEFGRDGGMRPTREDLEIRDGVLTYQTSYMEDKAGFTTKLTPDEIRSLYTVLHENKFDKIRLAKGLIHDKEGEFVRAAWPKQHFYLGTSGAEVENRWQEEWNRIVAAFDALIQSKVSAFRKPFTVVLDKNLEGNYTVVTLSEYNRFTAQVTAAGFSHTVQLLPGKYHVSAYAIRDYDPKKQMAWVEIQKRRAAASGTIDTQIGSKLVVSLVAEQKLTLESQ